ncbi:MAG: hypothetical protein H7836_14105 [Magnetococcus sp. YQC-3]
MDLSIDEFGVELQSVSAEVCENKYLLKDKQGNLLEYSIDDIFKRVARKLSSLEPKDQDYWYDEFLWAMRNGAIPAGRILSNAGAEEYKANTSTINCTVSEIIEDDLEDIYEKLKEAALTLKAGCVAKGTKVITEVGIVNVEDAVNEKHNMIMSYNIKNKEFEFKKILKHLTKEVKKENQIEIVSNRVSLKTSKIHPILNYLDGKLGYDKSEELSLDHGVIHYTLDYNKTTKNEDDILKAWFVGHHLGDGSIYIDNSVKYINGKNRLVANIGGDCLETIERYAFFFEHFYNNKIKIRKITKGYISNYWKYMNKSKNIEDISEKILDNQIGKKTFTFKIPNWIINNIESYFIPFLAGYIDADGDIVEKNGRIRIRSVNINFLNELKSIINYYGVKTSPLMKPEKISHHIMKNGKRITSGTVSTLEIYDINFIKFISNFIINPNKKNKIININKNSGKTNLCLITNNLKDQLINKKKNLTVEQKQKLQINYINKKQEISELFLNKYEEIPELKNEINFIKTLKKISSINKNLEEDPTFYDFEVEDNNNYLAGNNGFIVIHNCGIGYNFSTLRPKGAFIEGVGASTDGPLIFMDNYDTLAKTISSAGQRRSAQLASFHVSHPDIEEFITAKQELGRLRKFNLSVLITDEFIYAVKNNLDWDLYFPITKKEYNLNKDKEKIIWKKWPTTRNYIINDKNEVACKIYKTINAKYLYDLIMKSTFEYSEPGVLFYNTINNYNNLYWCEDIITTNP